MVITSRHLGRSDTIPGMQTSVSSKLTLHANIPHFHHSRQQCQMSSLNNITSQMTRVAATPDAASRGFGITAISHHLSPPASSQVTDAWSLALRTPLCPGLLVAHLLRASKHCVSQNTCGDCPVGFSTLYNLMKTLCPTASVVTIETGARDFHSTLLISLYFNLPTIFGWLSATYNSRLLSQLAPTLSLRGSVK